MGRAMSKDDLNPADICLIYGIPFDLDASKGISRVIGMIRMKMTLSGSLLCGLRQLWSFFFFFNFLILFFFFFNYLFIDEKSHIVKVLRTQS